MVARVGGFSAFPRMNSIGGIKECMEKDLINKIEDKDRGIDNFRRYFSSGERFSEQELDTFVEEITGDIGRELRSRISNGLDQATVSGGYLTVAIKESEQSKRYREEAFLKYNDMLLQYKLDCLEFFAQQSIFQQISQKSMILMFDYLVDNFLKDASRYGGIERSKDRRFSILREHIITHRNFLPGSDDFQRWLKTDDVSTFSLVMGLPRIKDVVPRQFFRERFKEITSSFSTQWDERNSCYFPRFKLFLPFLLPFATPEDVGEVYLHHLFESQEWSQFIAGKVCCAGNSSDRDQYIQTSLSKIHTTELLSIIERAIEAEGYSHRPLVEFVSVSFSLWGGVSTMTDSFASRLAHQLEIREAPQSPEEYQIPLTLRSFDPLLDNICLAARSESREIREQEVRRCLTEFKNRCEVDDSLKALMLTTKWLIWWNSEQKKGCVIL